jgi:predicted nuclease of predicted toxin-antitoxin system
VKLLLDQDFPLALCRALRGAGRQVEQVLPRGPHGLRDELVRARLETEALVFFTHDRELDDIHADFASQVVISLLPQHRPIGERVAIWRAAVDQLAERPAAGKIVRDPALG